MLIHDILQNDIKFLRGISQLTFRVKTTNRSPINRTARLMVGEEVQSAALRAKQRMRSAFGRVREHSSQTIRRCGDQKTCRLARHRFGFKSEQKMFVAVGNIGYTKITAVGAADEKGFLSNS